MSTPTVLAHHPHKMLNKVPEVTIFFWIIKILCTTVGRASPTTSTPPSASG
jgi:uncharacterized membrane-anchored protein